LKQGKQRRRRASEHNHLGDEIGERGVSALSSSQKKKEANSFQKVTIGKGERKIQSE